MKLRALLAIAYTINSVISISSGPDSEEIICNPEDSTDCYPKIFVPTDQWQTIREGQDIPPGLHVRLNIETLEREAKLLDEEPSHNDLLAVPQPESDQPDQPDQQPQLRKPPMSSKSKVSKEDLNNFESAIQEAGDFSDDYDRLNIALDVLNDLSHDIEFGAKLTTASSLTKLNHVLATSSDEAVHEKVFRLLAASLRNNPDAVDGFLRHTDRTQILGLFTRIGGDNSPVVQKRILGIILALAQNERFQSVYLANYGMNYLVEQYPTMNAECKERLVNLLEDQKFIAVNEKRDTQSADSQMSGYLQSSLADGKVSGPQFERYFQSLVAIHSENKSLKPSLDFLNWLAKEVELHKESRKRGEELSEFEQEMLRARHEVFGNPMGMRKAIADEL